LVRRLVGVFIVAIVVGTLGCGSNPRDLLVVRFDAGAADAVPDVNDASAGDEAAQADPTLGGPCVDDPQCDDNIPCTYDSCDPSLKRCRNVPDDMQCDDGIYCNGRELCVIGRGCMPGAVVTCEDGQSCTIDTCVEATKSCSHSLRDIDQDGDPDAHCAPGHDCNDLDPTVSSQHAEVCANGKDDNCNGLIDEQPCVTPQGGTCGAAVAAAGPGTYALSTVGLGKTFSTSCSVSTPRAGHDVVASVNVPAGPNVDLEVWATTATVEVSVAIQGICAASTSELACASAATATSVRARARNVAPGTYYVVVTTQSEADIELQVDFLAPTPRATNVDCGSATAIVAGTPTTVQIVDPPTNLPSACSFATGELTYALTLSQPQDVRVIASTLKGSGSPVVGLRAPPCTGVVADELRCAAAGSPLLYARNLGPGTYVITVAATSPIDASLEVQASPPTASPPDQTCASPPAIGQNESLAIDLSNHESAIKDGCLPGGPNAAYDLSLSAPSDVLLVARLPLTERGGVSLDTPACNVGRLGCDVETAPIRIGKRNVPQGDYRVVVADELGLQGQLDALVRPTVAPTIVPSGGADTCAQAIDASAGGFFTGDTSTAKADYDNPCDTPTSPTGGARDQVLSLVLGQPQRVVLDMEGSLYRTILDVRQGPGCPGALVTGACYVGFNSEKSFLDLELQAGSYWIIIDGFAGEAGAWDLDMRVLPP
jgi:Putative metal-binding motif